MFGSVWRLFVCAFGQCFGVLGRLVVLVRPWGGVCFYRRVRPPRTSQPPNSPCMFLPLFHMRTCHAYTCVQSTTRGTLAAGLKEKWEVGEGGGVGPVGLGC